jgi:hypothetical protein
MGYAMKQSNKLLVLLFILLTPALAFGDSVAGPSSYSVKSSNGKYVFVMIAPIAVEQDGIYLRNENRIAAQKIRSKYQVSGVYLNDNSNAPLWTVDWYAHRTLIASDGMHLISLGPWAQNPSTEAFTLFENGKQLCSYRVGDLVDTTFTLPHSVSHFIWDESVRLDDEKRIIEIVTLNKDRHVFDYTTGKRLFIRRPMRGIAVLVIAILGIATVTLIKRNVAHWKAAV